MNQKRKIYLTMAQSEIIVHIPYRVAVELIKPRIHDGSINALEFTHREREVFEGIRRDKANKEIGSELNIAERTVKFHVSQVLKKTGVKRRGEIVRLFGT